MEELYLSIKATVDRKALTCNVSSKYIAVKRGFDIFASLLGIAILLPLLILVSIAIKLDSRGSVFFAQERTGLKGKIFKMYKFRSMVVDAEQRLKDLESSNEAQGHMFKIKSDPRITRVGKFIRKTSIDELPQLINVLKGEMSIVGPRPPIVREVVQYDAWHNLRLSVKPGLTGLWQISGRNALGFDEMVRLDLKYIRERRLLYDFMIIIKTIPVLLGDNRAF